MTTTATPNAMVTPFNSSRPLTRPQWQALDTIRAVGQANGTAHVSPALIGMPIALRLIQAGYARSIQSPVWGIRVELTAAGVDMLAKPCPW